MDNGKLTQFKLAGELVPVEFVETQAVKEGVECDIYLFTDDSSKDLAIVRVSKGYKTPLQRVLLGNRTIEGLYSGSGTLTVQSNDGEIKSALFNSQDDAPIVVEVGQIMQWYANKDTGLVFYEICEPPYADGHFENLPENE